MKKTATIILFFLVSNFFSQENLFQKVKEQLKKDHPEIKLDNKLILINTWSINDAKSRETNIQVNKTLTVYGGSKLKGGAWGIIAVLICKDGDLNNAAVTLNKDQVNKPLVINAAADLNTAGFTNIVFDAAGKEIYKNISPENIYESIHQLITR